jgi:endoglucanase
MLSGFIETSYRVLFLWIVLTLHPAPAVQPGLGDGFWHTRGSQLLDSANRPVRIAGVNWYGFETTDAVPSGLRVQDYKTIITIIRRSGYNAIRLPFSDQMVETPAIPTAIAFNNAGGPINADLKGLNSLEILDRIVTFAGSQGLKVILDNHRSEAGDGTGLSGLWFTQAFPESAWIADWLLLTRRYANDPTVIGMDLRNEPHNANSNGACWSCGGPNDWHLAAQRAGNAVLAINPHLLIFVEGVDAFENDFYWWGGNLEGVHSAPVRLKIPNQLVYSAHDYGPAESGQSWLNPAMTDASLRAVWTRHWAYIMQQNIAPVWLGEFGTTTVSTDPPTVAESLQTRWFQSLTQFLSSDVRLSWSYWTLNGNDRYGLLNPNFDSIQNSARQDTLATIQFPLGVGLKSGQSSTTVVEPIAAPSVIPPNPATPSQPSPQSSVQPSLQSSAQTNVQSSAQSNSQPGIQPSVQSTIKSPNPAPARAQAPPPSAPAINSAIPRSISCSVTYTTLKDWQTGLTVALVIRNTGDTPFDSWRLTWTYNNNQKIDQLWGGHYTQQGPDVAVTNETWNALIPTNGEASNIGFNAAYTGQNTTPTKFYLNGVLCK